MSQSGEHYDTAMESLLKTDSVQAAARYAVAMHLAANASFGNWSVFVFLVAVAGAIYLQSLWPLAIGAVICLVIYVIIIQSCIRFVKAKTGMPDDLQAKFSNQYKTDPAFAKEVDALRDKSKNLA